MPHPASRMTFPSRSAAESRVRLKKVASILVGTNDPEPVPLEAVGGLGAILIDEFRHLMPNQVRQVHWRVLRTSFFTRSFFPRQSSSKVSRLEEPGIFATAGRPFAGCESQANEFLQGSSIKLSMPGVTQAVALCRDSRRIQARPQHEQARALAAPATPRAARSGSFAYRSDPPAPVRANSAE